MNVTSRPDLTTAEGAIAFCTEAMGLMAEQFLRDGEYPSPDGFLFVTRELPEQFAPGKPLVPGVLLPEAQAVRNPARAGGPIMTFAIGLRQDVVEKEIFARASRILAEATAAIGVVTLMETWYIENTLREGATPEERERFIKKGRWFEGEVKDQPDRKEALTVVLEHQKAGTIMWRAQIHRDPLRLDPWEKVITTTDGGSLEGRLTHLAGQP